MKILVCTDGSQQSQKALEKASVIAQGCNVHEVAIIHVDDQKQYIPSAAEGTNKEQMEKYFKTIEEYKEEKKKILQEALKVFEEKNIKARTILKEGHPSHIIVRVGCEEGFDMIVMGSRGLGGLKKVFLGSVSSAVVQEAGECSVLIVR
jgi:nucleotide-binding universal stress UspA family protein